MLGYKGVFLFFLLSGLLPAYQSQTPTFDNALFAPNQPFSDVMHRHQHALPLFQQWRQLITQHADSLAVLFATLPDMPPTDEAELQALLRSSSGALGSLEPHTLFEPWTNHWNGFWNNGEPQYHIWDQTRQWQNLWVQPVTQSIHRFANRATLPSMMQAQQVDVGINVFSEAGGITGWVSKQQHRLLEIPCIGYRLNPTTLIWFAQLQDPAMPCSATAEWFVFLEKASPDNQLIRSYEIVGRRIHMGKTVYWLEDEMHHGHYLAAPERLKVSD